MIIFPIKFGVKLLIHSLTPTVALLLFGNNRCNQYNPNHNVTMLSITVTSQWGDCVLNHQPPDCLLNRRFGRRSKKISELRVTGHCAGNSPLSVNSPHKGSVTRKMFVFDDVIMLVKRPGLGSFLNCSYLEIYGLVSLSVLASSQRK